MSEFSDRPFVAGSLTGVRSFQVDRYGRLRGVSYPEIFKPGQNDARCFAKTVRPEDIVAVTDPTTNMFTTLTYSMTWGMAPPSLKELRNRPGCGSVAQVNCQCGFYAYFDEGNDYKTTGTITALIDGWGVCTVGSRGFRAAAARLVALVERNERRTPKTLQSLVRRNYPDVPWYSTKREAVEAFPLTHQATPEDDDFWTRSV